MSLTGTLLFATGLIHNVLGIISPRLREPLLRLMADGGTLVVPDVNERHARENTFWFQFAGIALMIHGCHARSLALQLKKQGMEDEAASSWLGWVVLATGAVGAYIKPVSGFHLVYLQGIRLLWIQHTRNGLEQGKND
ncbi:expressed unknown protein [Seminavis robusta]|uniref:Uncharacterized protein n=1 Tax=Seminavis robusta TaxID=568900 RepID=A0A9N8ET31_9STRA|nr:expressed unknown protein [Seminavis robusta]|eukprot:Sro1883_g303420.1 n/a (138) ;mRNA; r:11408-11821